MNTNSGILSYERRRTLILVKDLINEVISKDGVNEDILMDVLVDKINNAKTLDEFDITTILYLEAELTLNE